MDKYLYKVDSHEQYEGMEAQIPRVVLDDMHVHYDMWKKYNSNNPTTVWDTVAMNVIMNNYMTGLRQTEKRYCLQLISDCIFHNEIFTFLYKAPNKYRFIKDGRIVLKEGSLPHYLFTILIVNDPNNSEGGNFKLVLPEGFWNHSSNILSLLGPACAESGEYFDLYDEDDERYYKTGKIDYHPKESVFDDNILSIYDYDITITSSNKFLEYPIPESQYVTKEETFTVNI